MFKKNSDAASSFRAHLPYNFTFQSLRPRVSISLSFTKVLIYKLHFRPLLGYSSASSPDCHLARLPHTIDNRRARPPTSTMHQALCIDEIIRLIFDICANEGQSALGQLARCCKAWKDPALDNLWRHLPCAAPLLRLIPGVIEKEGVFVSCFFIYCGPNNNLRGSADAWMSYRRQRINFFSLLRSPH